ncbi:hypothetical protein [Pseudonocardia acaciae]|uniref:hypothetical protein n=1 Tax=Pseudonocardia acaciae TaxID=551276 RepID=UPI00048D6392|nr:hypothetical protein [Pseudonocardia acaciae]
MTAWGHDWVRLAEPTRITRPDPSLPRARSLTRRDRVRDMELGAGTVRAVVHDRTERRVHITVPTWDDAQLTAARAALAASAAPVTGDDLPDAVHAALRSAGLPLAPDPATLGTGCDCARPRGRPDGRCVHLLASYFEVARRLDERPRLALLLRGLAEAPAAGTARIPLGLIDPGNFYGPGN